MEIFSKIIDGMEILSHNKLVSWYVTKNIDFRTIKQFDYTMEVTGIDE